MREILVNGKRGSQRTNGMARKLRKYEQEKGMFKYYT